MTDVILDSLQRRMRAMHSLWFDAVASMDGVQVNHFERPGVLPIAFSLFHQAQIEDGSVTILGGPGSIWSTAWAERLHLTVADHGKERTVEEMELQRIGDYDAFVEYQRAVFDKTEAWLAGIDRTDLSRVLFDGTIPERIARTYSARVAGPGGLTVHDAVECWIYQHGIRHLGEVEHARALVGLGGLTS